MNDKKRPCRFPDVFCKVSGKEGVQGEENLFSKRFSSPCESLSLAEHVGFVFLDFGEPSVADRNVVLFAVVVPYGCERVGFVFLEEGES